MIDPIIRLYKPVLDCRRFLQKCPSRTYFYCLFSLSLALTLGATFVTYAGEDSNPPSYVVTPISGSYSMWDLQTQEDIRLLHYSLIQQQSTSYLDDVNTQTTQEH